MEILFSRSPYKQKRVLISADIAGVRAGHVDYLNNRERPFANVGLLRVKETFQGLGIGRSLVRQLAEDLGRGRAIRAVVSHNATLDYLEELNPRPEAYVNLSYTFSDRDLLREVPIVRVFESGGIQIVRMRVNYNSQRRRIETRDSVSRATLTGVVL